MQLIFFFSFRLFITLLLLPLLAASAGSDDCEETRCRTDGPTIRFPFKLKHIHAQHCGYPGFELSCHKNDNSTVMELPHGVQLQVSRIDYVSQQIFLYDPDGCLLGKMMPFNLNLSQSPFQYSSDLSLSNLYSLFNCSAFESAQTSDDLLIPCLGVPGHQVYAIPSFESTDKFPSPSCIKFQETSLESIQGTLQLNWLTPLCSKCEAQGKICSLNNHNNITLGVQCSRPDAPRSKTPIIAGATLGFFLLAFLTFGTYQFYTTGKMQKQNQERVEKFLEDYRAIRPTRYSFADIKKITNQFSERLGEGGYGTVYKGKLSSEIHVAVKVLNDSKGNGEEFINEVGIIGKIHHVNVVRLVGYCADGFRRALVYEYLPNESMEKYIFSSGSKNVALGWKKIQEIAHGIAKGIEYLHQGCDQQILHFDIKPNNILLDHNMNPKICDFGLAKLCSKEKSAVTMTAARGTMGYIAPEVVSRNFGKVSHKSDVYSFGMLLLEMVGGRKNFDANNKGNNTTGVSFPEWVYNELNRGGELRIRIEEKEDEVIVKKLAIIALWCIQWQPVDRPSMKVVVQMLEREGHNLALPPSSPFVAASVNDVPLVLGEPFYKN